MEKLWQMSQQDLLTGHLTRIDCPVCNGTGQATCNGFTSDCECTFRPGQYFRTAGFPARFDSETLATLNWELLSPATLPRLIKGYADGFEDASETGQGIVFWGPPGNGKTHVAVGIGKIACALGYQVRFAVVADWLETLRAAFDEPKQERLGRPLWEDAHKSPGVSDADLLILDDLGLESETPWVREKIYQLINRRWLEQLPTIVTTNRPPEDLARRYGEGVVSRLWGSSLVLHFEGSDHRLNTRGPKKRQSVRTG